jgi:peptidoglycan/xylan/chitin deacetylase (PgdA/CDA1 family)
VSGPIEELHHLAAGDRRRFLAMLAAGVVGVLSGCAWQAQPDHEPAPAGDGSGPALAPAPLAFPRGVARPLPPIPAGHPGPPTVVHSAPGGPGSTPRVALTIDDGLSAETVAGYVDFAERTGIPITFCPNGIYQSRWNPHAQQLKPLIEAGQVQIANHTYTHQSLVDSSNAEIRADLERNEEWIEKTFGITARPWMRPPFGYHSGRTDEVAGELGYTRILMWEGSFGDARLLTPEVLMDQARQWLTGGRIVLGHANHPTVTHLYDQLVALIQRRRLRPVTLDTMFGTSRAVG